MGLDEAVIRDISLLHNFVDDTIKPELERVPGIGQTNFFGGRERELQVIVDPGGARRPPCFL